MNQFIATGRLVRDPDVKMINDKTLAKFTLAVDSGYGEHKRTDFIDCTAWGRLAEIIGNNLTKGRKILVEGQLHIRSYENKDGQKRKATEVVISSMEFLESKQQPDSAADVSQLGEELAPDEFPF